MSSEVEAILMTRDLQAAAIHQKCGAFGFTGIDVAFDLVAVLTGHQGAHVLIIGIARTDTQCFDHRLEFGYQLLSGGIADADCDRNGHAALPGRAVAGTQQCIGGLVHVGIRHDHHMVLATAESLHTLACSASTGIDVFSNRCGADETDGVHTRVIEQDIHGFLVAMYDIQYAVR